MMYSNALERKGYRKDVIEFFEPYYNISADGTIRFPYHLNKQGVEAERVSNQRTFVPNSQGLWEAAGEIPILVRNLFIFSSALESLTFFHFYPNKLKTREQLAIVSLGLVPGKTQVKYLQNKYPNAKVHLIFDSTILGKIIDCKLALWFKNKDAQF